MLCLELALSPATTFIFLEDYKMSLALGLN